MKGKQTVRESMFHVLIPPIKAGLIAGPIEGTIETFMFLLLLFSVSSLWLPKLKTRKSWWFLGLNHLLRTPQVVEGKEIV